MEPVLDVNFFPFVQEADPKKSGMACLQMICKFYGSETRKVNFLKDKLKEGKGITMLDVKLVADKIGFKTFSTVLNYERLLVAPLPGIVHWHSMRFVVINQVVGDKVYICDPCETGTRVISKEDFLQGYTKEVATNSVENPHLYRRTSLSPEKKPGVVLLMEPSPQIFA